MIEKSSFIDLEKARKESLKQKIQDGINDIEANPGKQWIPLRLERPLLDTLLQIVEKEIKSNTKEMDKVVEYIKCPKCSGMGEYHDEINYPLGREKLVECDMCHGQQEIKVSEEMSK